MKSHIRPISAVLSTLALSASLSSAGIAYADPILLTISDTEAGQSETWWPNHNVAQSPWFPLFDRQGVSLVHSSAASAPRLSPAVYAPAPLSDAHARTLASLFGTHSVLNGNTDWQCLPKDDVTECSGSFHGHFLPHTGESLELAIAGKAAAESAEMARAIARNAIATELATTVMAMSMRVQTKDTPNLIDKPVLIFSALPDADTLVQLRKTLKTIPGVEDVAERWIADNALAIELNPAQNTISDADFSRIVQELASTSVENLIIRHTRSTPQGAVFEIVKY